MITPPGDIVARCPDAVMAMVVPVRQPDGVVLPELVQWLPVTALDQPIGNISGSALRATTTLVAALVS